MQQGYAYTVDLGSKILLKVSNTSCDSFNKHVFTKLEKFLTLEQKYELLYPKLMLQDFEYPAYGPVGICSLLQSEYRYFVIRNICTAISLALTSAPESNLNGGSGQQRNTSGLRCHKCNSEFRIFPDCSHRRNGGYNHSTPRTNSNSNSTSNSN